MRRQALKLGRTAFDIEFIRFLAVGLFNTLIGYIIIFGCMFLLNLSPELSNALGYGLGLVISYTLNKTLTFRSRERNYVEAIKFVAVFLIAFGLNFAALHLLLYTFGVNAILSQILAGVLYIAASYAMNKLYVFRAKA